MSGDLAGNERKKAVFNSKAPKYDGRYVVCSRNHRVAHKPGVH